MKSFFVFIFSAVILISAPYAAQATEVGFVPSSGIWFSKQTIAPGGTVKIYAVIVNNAYSAVRANIAFYDNGDEIGIIKVEKLEKERAHELWMQWTPHPGSHKIAARFIHAAVVGADGKETVLDPAEINTIGENSFVAPPSVLAGGSAAVGASGPGGVVQQGSADSLGVLQGNIVASSTFAASLAQNANALAGDGVTVQVKKEGDQLVLNILAPVSLSSNVPARNQESLVNSAASAPENAARASSVSSTLVERVKNTVETAVEKIKNIGETVRNAREITVRTIHGARDAAEIARAKAEVVGQTARGVGRNKIALAWGGFLAFIALAGILSYARWRKFR